MKKLAADPVATAHDPKIVREIDADRQTRIRTTRLHTKKPIKRGLSLTEVIGRIDHEAKRLVAEQFPDAEAVDRYVTKIFDRMAEQTIGHHFGFEWNHWNGWRMPTHSSDTVGSVAVKEAVDRFLTSEAVQAQLDAVIQKKIQPLLNAARKHFQDQLEESFSEAMRTSIGALAQEHAQIEVDKLLDALKRLGADLDTE